MSSSLLCAATTEDYRCQGASLSASTWRS
jgi:hypothetical protein